MKTLSIFFASGCVGFGIAVSALAGDWAATAYGVGILAILLSMHDVTDIHAAIQSQERAS